MMTNDIHIFDWGDNKRYNSYANYFKKQFGGRVQKISINAGFTCPNRDGTVGTGGCTFCNNDAFNPSYCRAEKSILQQIEEGIEFHHKRYRRAKRFQAYFQAYSNTYKPVEQLRSLYNEAISHENVIGIVIGTRPDCINDDILGLLKEIQRTHYVMLEFGIESIYDQTLKRVNRGHNFETARKAIEITHQAGIPCGGHFIFGLPGETREMMQQTAEIISTLPLTTVKFHQLQLFKGSEIEKEFRQNPEDFYSFTIESYIEFIVEFIEKLSPNIVIERFVGEVPPRFLSDKPWAAKRYDVILQLIEGKLEEKNTFQGKNFVH